MACETVRHEQSHSNHQVDLSRQRTRYLHDSQQDLWMVISWRTALKSSNLHWMVVLKSKILDSLSLFSVLSLFLRNVPPNIHPPPKKMITPTNCTVATFVFFPFRSPKLLWCHWSFANRAPGRLTSLSLETCYTYPTNSVSLHLCQTKYLKREQETTETTHVFSSNVFFVSCISSSPNVNNKERVGKIGFSNQKRSSFELKAQKTKLTCLLYMSTQPDILGSSYWIQLSLWFPQQQRMLPLCMMKGLSSATRCFWPGMNVLELIIPSYSCYVPKPLRLMQILQMQSVGRITLAKATIVLPRAKLKKMNWNVWQSTTPHLRDWRKTESLPVPLLPPYA